MLSREQLLLKQMAGNPKVAYRIERGELPLWMHLAAEHRKQEENLDKAGRAPEEQAFPPPRRGRHRTPHRRYGWRSEEHTSELQSRFDLVCRLLLEKKEDTATRKRPRVY